MSQDYLKTVRKSGSTVDSKTTEAELITTREDFAASFEELNDIRKQIIQEKIEACAAIDAAHQERLKELEASYALLLSLSR